MTLVISDSGDKWSVKSEGNTLVWTFEEGMDLSKFKEEAYPTYESILADEGQKVNGMITIVNFDDPFNEDALKVWENAGKKAQEEGIEKWVIVADGLTQLSLRDKLDYENLRVKGEDSEEKAIKWARE